jgi:putative hydrolase of the HAD superfamily
MTAPAVVFDFGAVLFQWKPLQLLQQVVPELAPDESAAKRIAGQIFESFTPESDWALFDLGKLDETALAERIARRLAIVPAQVRRVIDAIPPHLVAQAPAVGLFRRLKACGHRMFFLSNMPPSYAAHLERENPFIAEFDDGIYSGRVGLMKPQPAIFELAERRFGLDPLRTMFIDDHAGNADAARARGWQAAHFVGAEACEAWLAAQGWLQPAGGGAGVRAAGP